MKQKQIAKLIKQVINPKVNYPTIANRISPHQLEVELDDKVLSAVLMDNYDINSVILTEHKNLQNLIDDFEESDDTSWFDGKGKRALYEYLHKHLKKEDTYFNKRANEMNTKNQRWVEFCEDCIILVTLGNALYQTPIFLLHPNTYMQSITSNKKTWMNGANGKLPTLIKGIETHAPT